MRRLPFVALALLAGCIHAESLNKTLTLNAGDTERTNAVIRLALVVPTAFAHAGVLVSGLGEAPVVGQLCEPGLALDVSRVGTPPAGQVVRELIFVAPKLAKGSAVKAIVTLNNAAPAGALLAGVVPPGTTGFHWVDSLPDWSELRDGDKPVIRYIRTPISTDKAKRFDTMKVFHHVYDPDTGKILLTNGVGAKTFPHHRGVFYGFNKVSYSLPPDPAKPDVKPEVKQTDIWHCPVAFQLDGGTVFAEGGPVVGRHRVKIEWHGVGKDLFANELREVTIIKTPGGTLMDWASKLEATDFVVKLDGDPQHAGFHFRANPDVAEQTLKQTYYLRPDGKGELDATRNWPGQKQHVNLPWDTMCFLLGGQRYSVAYLDRPQNPKEARFSERDYGRFGSYFVTTVEKDKPLLVNYRLWFQSGEMTGDQVAALDADLATPVTAVVSP